MWPLPRTTYLYVVSSSNAIGPRACRRLVLMPISAPNPNSPPSLKRVEAFQITADESTSRGKINGAEKGQSVRFLFRDNRIAMVGSVGLNVFHCLFQRIDDSNRQD